MDASHGVHGDCRGQTGDGMQLGQGAIISFSRKQKVNTKSSTESELVGVNDAMPDILWSLYFLQEQGFETSHAVVYQDNKSAILLEINGKQSSSKRTKHIKMKYFFVKDKVDEGEVRIEHKPSEEMWVDILTKPKQGRPFRVDRSKLMNCAIDLPDETLTMSLESSRPAETLQKCVGHNGNSSALAHKKRRQTWQAAVAPSEYLKGRGRRTDKREKHVIGRESQPKAAAE